MNTKVYVGNLSYETKEDDLRTLFGAEGREITDVAIPTDRETGRVRGFAFVTFASSADAAGAIASLDGQSLGGRTLKVSEAQDRRNSGGDRARSSRW